MFCTKCGKEVEDDWNICPNCGSILRSEESDNMQNSAVAQKPKKKFNKKWWFLGGVIVVGLMLIGVFIGVMESKSKKSEKKEAQEQQVDYSKMDFEVLIGRDEKNLKKSGLEESNEYMGYGALDGDIDVICTDGVVTSIIIKDDSKKTPSFHGARIGMSADEAYEKIQSAYGEVLYLDEEEGIFMNLSIKGCVDCKITDGKVSTIIYATVSDEDIDSYKQEKEQKEAEAKKKAEEEAEAKKKAEEEAEKANSIDSFIGMPGVYICTSPEWDNFTGRIEFGQIQNGAMSFSMGLLELDYQIFKGSAVIIDSNTAQINADGITITITWTNSENMYVTKEGELNNNRDAGTVSAITDNMSYIRASEFN